MNKIKNIVTNVLSKLSHYSMFKFINTFREKRNNKLEMHFNEKLESANCPMIEIDNKDNLLVALISDGNNRYAYWGKFERFLKVNKVQFNYLSPYGSNFLEEVKNYDIVIWRVSSVEKDLSIAKPLIYMIDKIMNKTVLPNYDSLWSYEEKINQYYILKYLKLNPIETFISYDFCEVKDYLKQAKYPLISKLNTASASKGVRMIKNYKSGLRYFKEVFRNGAKTDIIGMKQYNYAYLQPMIKNEGYDLRIIIVGDSYFGYYRYPKNNDFRASGSGLVRKFDIPKELLLVSKEVKENLPYSYMLAIDFLKSTEDGKFKIIETSIFIKIETSEQLVVNEVPGRYVYKNGDFVFEKGNFWLQDLMLIEVFKNFSKEEKLV